MSTESILFGGMAFCLSIGIGMVTNPIAGIFISIGIMFGVLILK